MKWRESLFMKIMAIGLFLLFSVGAVLGGVATVYCAIENQVYEDSYYNTRTFRDSMAMEANHVEQYYSLISRQELGESLTWEDQEWLRYLQDRLFPSGGTNLVWVMMDKNERLLITNLDVADADSAETLEHMAAITQGHYLRQTVSSGVVAVGLDASLPVYDSYAQGLHDFNLAKEWIVPIVIATIVCVLLTLVLFAFLIAAAGHKEGVPGIALNVIDRIWLEVLLVGGALVFVLMLDILFNGYTDPAAAVVLTVILLLVLGVILFSLLRRAKAGMLYKTSFLHLCVRAAKLVIRHLPVAVVIGLAIGLWGIVQFILVTGIVSGSGLALLLWMGSYAALLLLGILVGVQYTQLSKATDRIARGELGPVINESTVPFFTHLARNLNSTGHALNLAVRQHMQSERLKTELITNVSHDIKTPLTSIISYVDLLKNTDLSDPKAREYLDVLDRKSRRLAQLMADLVEASKVTTGNVSVNMEVLNIGELVKQAGGEMEARLAEHNIQLVCALPSEPAFIYADGRHMWRILDNLFSNAAKYALDGTRVYVDLTDMGSELLLSVKNISRDPLNIQPEDLMERFVRGDESRQADGSGLGLSIARSLMELQGGSMNILIDGDLFKVVLSLKRVPAPIVPTPASSPPPPPPDETAAGSNATESTSPAITDEPDAPPAPPQGWQ